MKIVILVISSIIFMAVNPAFAEKIILRSGQEINGEILKKNDKYVEIETDGSPVTLLTNDIKQIVSEGVTTEMEFANSEKESPKAAPTAPTDQQKLLPEAQEYVEEARGLIDAKKYEEVIPVLKKLLVLTPEISHALYISLGAMNYYVGNLEESVYSFKEAMRIMPEDKKVYAYLGIVYFSSGQKEKANEYFSLYLSDAGLEKSGDFLDPMFIAEILKK